MDITKLYVALVYANISATMGFMMTSWYAAHPVVRVMAFGTAAFHAYLAGRWWDRVDAKNKELKHDDPLHR